MRRVVDTNVVVSALLWQGIPGRLLEMARERQARLFASPVLLAELADVLARGEGRRSRSDRIGRSQTSIDPRSL
jgi:putative PIN family toxin of toxin-antitoxin system